MKQQAIFKGVGLALLTLFLAAACEQPRYIPPPPPIYYVSPTTSYLRNCPAYECTALVDVYSGDRVELLDRADYGWSQVRLSRSGIVGWIPTDLLSPYPGPSTYYVSLSNVYLRDCADYNCRALELLYRGDRVERLDQNYLGWWRVVSLKTRNIGWVPASALGPRPGPPFFYVNVRSLNLRAGPSSGSKIIGTLSLNDQVEMLGMGPGGWAQVRVVRTGIIGWVASRYLESFPVRHPRTALRKGRGPAKPREKEAAPKPALPKAM